MCPGARVDPHGKLPVYFCHISTSMWIYYWVDPHGKLPVYFCHISTSMWIYYRVDPHGKLPVYFCHISTSMWIYSLLMLQPFVNFGFLSGFVRANFSFMESLAPRPTFPWRAEDYIFWGHYPLTCLVLVDLSGIYSVWVWNLVSDIKGGT
jgi:hypothetical protein